MTTSYSGTTLTFPDNSTLTTAGDVAYIDYNGYQLLPGGLIMQWGQFNSANVNNQFANGSGTFRMAFPNACLGVLACNGPIFSSLSTTRFGITCSYDFLGYDAFVATTRYIVIGY
jgi:hypothetical protein